MTHTLRTYLGTLLAIVTLLLALYMIWLHVFKADVEQKVKEYWETGRYKPDTIIVQVDYPDIKFPKYPNHVPPQIVIEYNEPSGNGISLQVLDSLLVVIDSLKKTQTNINPNYIKLFPSSPKLLYGDFTQDSLRFDLLTIDGRTRTEKYPVNYSRFNYQYQNNEFRAIERTNTTQNSRTRKTDFNWYATGGYRFLRKAPSVGTLFQLSEPLPRLSLFGEADITIEQEPNLNLEVKLGYRIK